MQIIFSKDERVEKILKNSNGGKIYLTNQGKGVIITDTKNMARLTELDISQIFSLVNQSGQMKELAIMLFDTLERALLYRQIVEVFAHYDLGKVTEVYEIFGGYVNRSFGVYTQKDEQRHEYFVRMYKAGITETEIQLEHSLIDFSIVHGLDIAAGLIRSNDRKTYVKLSDTSNGKKVHRFFAIYDFLRGEDKYTWDDPTLNDEEYASAAEVLATFHNASREFDPQGRERVEPRIMELLPMLPGVFREFAEIESYTKFHKYYLDNLDQIMTVLQKLKIAEEDLANMPLNPIHSDFHPGNLKFSENKVVGIFDFDWCKIDYRLFDVCFAIVYFCASWQDEKDGIILQDKCRIFLETYQKTLRSLNGLMPLNETELAYLPDMIAAANIYLMNWTLSTFYRTADLNVYEYLAYLKHNIRLMKWIDNNKDALNKIVEELAK